MGGVISIIREFAPGNLECLLSLPVPVQRASERCSWLKAMVNAGEIFHPRHWMPRDTLQLLRAIPQLETAGVVVRMPAAWQGNRTPRPKATGTVGTRTPSRLEQNALLDSRVEVTLDGDPLTAAEIRDLPAHTESLVPVRGQWIAPDRERFESMLARFGEMARTARKTGLAFGDAMRLPPIGRKWPPEPGWRKPCRGCATRRNWRKSTPARRSRACGGPTNRWAYAGCISSRNPVWEPGCPTVSARASIADLNCSPVCGGVDEAETIVLAVQAKPLAKQAPAAGEILRGEDRGAVFGLHMAQRASFDAAFEGRKPAKPTRAPKPGA
jgi:hypothetical protein